METFPAFFPLSGQRVVIAGEGEPAEAKARLFTGSPAEVVRIAGEAAFQAERYAGARLVFVASFDRAFQDRASAAARGCGAPVNVVDRPDLSDFHTPALVDRGALVVAVGTTGVAPVLASLLRSDLEARLPPGLEGQVRLLADRRAAIREAFPDLAKRRAFFRSVLSAPALTDQALDQAIARAAPPAGGVTFILAPPEEDLISVRAVRALSAADVVVGDPDDPLIARHARRDAERRTPEAAPDVWILQAVQAGLNVAVIASAPPQGLARELGARAVLLAPAPDT